MANFYAAILAILLIITVPNNHACDTTRICDGQSVTYSVGDCETNSVYGSSYSVQVYCKNEATWIKSYTGAGCSGSVYKDINVKESAEGLGCTIDDCCTSSTPSPTPASEPTSSPSMDASGSTSPSNPSSLSSSSGASQIRILVNQILFNIIAAFVLYSIVY